MLDATNEHNFSSELIIDTDENLMDTVEGNLGQPTTVVSEPMAIVKTTRLSRKVKHSHATNVSAGVKKLASLKSATKQLNSQKSIVRVNGEKLASKQNNRSAAIEAKIAPRVSSELSKSKANQNERLTSTGTVNAQSTLDKPSMRAPVMGPFRRSRRERKQPDRLCITLGAGFDMVPGYANNDESPAQRPLPIFDSDNGYFNKLFQNPVMNFAHQVLTLQSYWQEIDSTNIYIDGLYTVNRKSKVAVMRRGVYGGFWNFTQNFYDAHKPGFDIKNYHYKDNTIIKFIPKFFVQFPEHKLWVTIASKNHMCALLIFKEGGNYKFFAFDPNLGHICQPLMNLINKIQSAKKTKEIHCWGARNANKYRTCVGLTWAFLSHIMINLIR